LDEFIVMQNHLHIILIINNDFEGNFIDINSIEIHPINTYPVETHCNLSLHSTKNQNKF
jgi:hypothetical protein